MFGKFLAAAIAGLSIGYAIHCLFVWLAWWMLSVAFQAIPYPTTAQVMAVSVATMVVMLALGGSRKG